MAACMAPYCTALMWVCMLRLQGQGRLTHENGDVYDKAHGKGKFLHADGSRSAPPTCRHTGRPTHPPSAQHTAPPPDRPLVAGELAAGRLDRRKTFATRTQRNRWTALYCTAAHRGRAWWTAQGVCVVERFVWCSYEGEWVEDMQEGRGVERWADGSRFEGEYRRSKKHGQGTFRWAEGSRCVAQGWWGGGPVGWGGRVVGW